MLKIFDMHIHSNMGNPDPEGLLKKMEKGGVWGGAIFSAFPFDKSFDKEIPFDDRMKNLFGWVHGHEDRLFPVYWVHPFEKNVEENIDKAAKMGVVAYKMICEGYNVADEKVLKLLERMASHNLPIIFHSGSLYDDMYGLDTAKDNHPSLWENMMKLNVPVRFSLAHCGWPWMDEALALLGKLRYLSGKYGKTVDMYIDTTPGTPLFQRGEMFNKLVLFNNPFDKVMYGSDLSAEKYPPDISLRMIAHDITFAEVAGCNEEMWENFFYNNAMTFFNK